MGQLTPVQVHSGCWTGAKILLVFYRSCEMKQWERCVSKVNEYKLAEEESVIKVNAMD